MKKQIKKPTRKTSRKKAQRFPKITHFARFVPAIVISIFATYLWAQPFLVGFSGSGEDVLSYATNTSPAGLLSATNAQRTAGGVGSLKANSKLASAAQAKAADMVARDYWAHVTPDGKQPWVFITNAGYQYLAAGENLAYGFLSSGDTITGWMNSPSHRTNLMNSDFTEVGFGMANSADFVDSGQQTVVVAMYGKPQSAEPPALAAGPTKPSKPAPKPKPVEITPAKTVEEDTEVAQPVEEPISEPIAVDEDEHVVQAAQTKVNRVQLMTGGNLAWSATFVALAVTATFLLWIIHKGVNVRRWLRDGEHFITHHIHLDFTVLALIYLGTVLLTGSGVIR